MGWDGYSATTWLAGARCVDVPGWQVTYTLRYSLLFAVVLSVFSGGAAWAQVSVPTRAYDNARTGWNAAETTLTPKRVAGNSARLSFGHLLPDTDLSESDGAGGPVYNQIDAQPLVARGVSIVDPLPGAPALEASAWAERDIVYLVTEANYIYAVDGETGRIVKKRKLNHRPVNYPNGCLNNAATVGITSTPVIDLKSQAMFLIAYADTEHGHTYYLHKISLATLDDLPGSPVEIKTGARLANGDTLAFDPTYQRQRAALLLHNGLLYAGFASFCDEPRDKARGWLMAWYANSLRPFPLTNDPGAPSPFLVNQTSGPAAQEFLSGIWMSGAGPAADETGDIYFTTGNSSRAPLTYDAAQNLAESFIRYSPWDKKVAGYFTPANVQFLEENDQDFGAGGPVLVPGHADGLSERLALAAGKDGRLYLLDRDDLGGFHTGPGGADHVLGAAATTGEGEECRCNTIVMPGPRPLVAIGAGTNLSLFRVGPGASGPLQPVGRSELVDSSGATANGPFGFGIAGSSDGTDHPIIWAVSRPGSSSDVGVYLYAFDPTQLDANGGPRLLTRQHAGDWPFTYATTGVIPVVANGKVYVATMDRLVRFGLTPVHANTADLAGPQPAQRGRLPALLSAGAAPGPGAAPASQPATTGNTRTVLGQLPPKTTEEAFQIPLPSAFSTRVTGFVTDLRGMRMRLKTLLHKEVRVDISAAAAKHRLPVVFRVGSPVQVLGDVGHDAQGVLIYGRVVNDAGDSTKLWEPDVMGDTNG